jgi:hypothetical protein
MTINVIDVTASKKSVFVEGKNAKINYQTITANNFIKSFEVNNTSDQHVFLSKENTKVVKVVFKYNESQSKEYVTSQRKYYELSNNVLNDANYKPFSDNNITQIRVSFNDTRNCIGSLRTSNGNQEFENKKTLPFYDKENPIHKDNILLENFDDEEFDYNFTFNYSDFTFRGGRIDAFSNTKKIQMSEDSIEALKGFRFNDTGKSKSAFGINNTITQEFRKEDDKVFPYSDDVIETFLADKNISKKINKLNYVYDADTNAYSENTSTNVLITNFTKSIDARFFAFEEKKYHPFYDMSPNNNFWWISNNKYIFTDSDINNKILNIRDKNEIISEDILYSSHGKDLNKEYSVGRDSIGFYESID